MIKAAVRLLMSGVLLSALGLSACAEFKETGRIIGHTTRNVTREIGHGSRDAVKTIGHGAKRVAKSITEDGSNSFDSK
jgi:hypothetical protein